MQRSGLSMALDTLGVTRLGLRGVTHHEPPNANTGYTLDRPALAWRLIPLLVLVAWLAPLALGPAVVPSTQAAAPCHVPSSAYPTIQEAVNAPACATINVAAGTYTELVTIGRDVTIRGEGQDSTVVDGSGGRGSVLTISSGTVTIQGVTIQHGLSFSGGGGILNEGTLTVQNSTLADNEDGILGGGGILNVGTLTIKNSSLAHNDADGPGGGIFNEAPGTLTIENSTLADNRSAYGGGGIFNEGTLTIENSTLSGNGSQGGGGILNFGTLTIENSTLSDNLVGLAGGGGIFNEGTLTIENSTLSDNQADGEGAGIFNFGTLTVQNSTLADNQAGRDGGGIFNEGTLTIENSTLSDNQADGEGGGIFNEGGGTVTLTHVTFENNTPNDCTGCPIEAADSTAPGTSRRP